MYMLKVQEIEHDVYESYIPYCDKCDICIANRMTPSGGKGKRHSCLYISSNPTKVDVSKGVFTSRYLKQIKQYADKYYLSSFFTYLVKCSPNRHIRDFEISNCKEYLVEEIYILKPKIIITIGSSVTKCFISFKNFSSVVFKPKVVVINNREIIVLPIPNPSDRSINTTDELDKAFDIICKLYKAFVDPDYIML